MKNNGLAIIDYVCNDCGSRNWKIRLVCEEEEEDEFGKPITKTHLQIICGNEQCVEKRVKELSIKYNENYTSDQITYGTFDVTGQGYDFEDIQDLLQSAEEETKILN